MSDGYSVKSMISDLANLKDLHSNSMKNNSYDIIKDILLRAEDENESEDTLIAKEFAEEFKATIVGIANDLLINADNKEDQVNVPDVYKDEEDEEKEEDESENYEIEIIDADEDEEDDDEDKE